MLCLGKKMDRQELLVGVSKIKWWHQIDLGQGVITSGPDPTIERIEWLGVPKDLRGKTVLDIGAWDGAFAFEAERRGASRVLAVDEFIWAGKGWGIEGRF